MWYYIGYFENISLFSFVVAIFYKQLKNHRHERRGGGGLFSVTVTLGPVDTKLTLSLYLSEPLISVNN